MKPLIQTASVLFALLVSGCSNVVPVTGTTPAPLIGTLPVTMGVVYDDGFRNYVYEQHPDEGGKWRIELGDLNIQFFDRVFSTMFSSVVTVPGTPLTENPRGVQAVLYPTIEEYGFLTPRDSGLRFYAVSIKYRVQMYTPEGELIAAWPIVAYGKSPAKGLTGRDSLQDATRLAIRDGAAAMVLDFHKQPTIRDWLVNNGVVRGTGGEGP